ncbi:hypothetical protein UlMin_003815 [Ulmus minor]
MRDQGCAPRRGVMGAAASVRFSGQKLFRLLQNLQNFSYVFEAQCISLIDKSKDTNYRYELIKRLDHSHYGNSPHHNLIKIKPLKEAIDDLEWLGASIQITLQPTPPSVTFRGDVHGDPFDYNNRFNSTISNQNVLFHIDFMYYANANLLIAFHCDCQVSHRYKYKFLKATTSNIPSSVIRDNRGSKLTIGRGGFLKIQHLVSVSTSSTSHTHIESTGYQLPSRIAYIEFFVKLEEDEGTVDD